MILLDPRARRINVRPPRFLTCLRMFAIATTVLLFIHYELAIMDEQTFEYIADALVFCAILVSVWHILDLVIRHVLRVIRSE
jgi:hypothetical protein